MRTALRGTDRAERPALPVGEALHPVTLAAIALLVVNDWWLKPHFGPSAVTGKLSDLGGLAFAPVVLSAAIGLVLHAAAALGARVDPSLSRRRLLACIAATGAGFAAIKLSPAAAGWLIAATELFGRHAEIYLDRTDLLCLPALAVAWWIGRDELRRIPLGRPAAIHRLRRPASTALADLPGDTEDLAAAIDAWDVKRIDDLLRPT
ncbi:MAG: hypothetical protein KF773_08235 [Deltaproteobacteria bacterium]|nr:hypothetical protein [Deltaproteobacteria bacterium]